MPAWVAALPVAAYALMLASNLLSGAAPAAVAPIGLVLMGIPIAVATVRLWRIRSPRAAR
jgi:hypothetical protein